MEERTLHATSSNSLLRFALLALQILAIVCFACFDVKYAAEDVAVTNSTSWDARTTYGILQDVHVMIFIGFGFLMTFLQDYNWSAVGFNFLIGGIALEWGLLVAAMLNGFSLTLDYTTIMNADFAAGAVLISFGAILGKVNHFQLLVMALLEIVIYQLNEHTCLHWLPASHNFHDIGGSMIIHTFGAYFGLAVSAVLYRKENNNCGKEGAKYHTDLFAMIGTIFLWMYWPSFNSIPGGSFEERQIVALNTYLALAASCVTTFALSGFGDKSGGARLDMVHIQNATLAGGVAMGASAQIKLGVFGAFTIGTVAGAVSTFGYIFLQEIILKVFRIHDTCGVHNLHGMPGVLGAVFSIIFGVIHSDSGYEWMSQLATLGMTLAYALVGGALTGVVMKLVVPRLENEHRERFEDAEHWTKEEE